MTIITENEHLIDYCEDGWLWLKQEIDLVAQLEKVS
jgi:hypothetical protein